MENLKDFFSNASERIKNPLIFSFLCSWIIFNWQVAVALFWYGTDGIEKINHSNLFEYLSAYFKANAFHLFLWPLIAAILYTLVMPIIKNVLTIFYAYVNKKGEDKSIAISRTGFVRMTKYLNVRQDYEKRTKALQEVIDSESVTIEKLNAETELRLKAEQENNAAKLSIKNLESDFEKVFNIATIQGFWYLTFEYTVSESGTQNTRFGKELIQINSGSEYILQEKSGSRSVFLITNYCYNEKTRSLFFIKKRTDIDRSKVVPESLEITDKNLINDLLLREDGLVMSGRENDFINVTYRKVTEIGPHDNYATMIIKAERLIAY